MLRNPILSKSKFVPSMVVQVYNPSTWQTEAGGLWVQDQSGLLHNETLSQKKQKEDGTNLHRPLKERCCLSKTIVLEKLNCHVLIRVTPRKQKSHFHGMEKGFLPSYSLLAGRCYKRFLKGVKSFYWQHWSLNSGPSCLLSRHFYWLSHPTTPSGKSLKRSAIAPKYAI
jgi:hypothetical protein